MPSRELDEEPLSYLLHEVRNPLAVIKGQLELFEEGVRTDSVQEFVENYEDERIDERAEKLLEVARHAERVTIALSQDRNLLDDGDVSSFIYEEDVQRLRQVKSDLNSPLEEMAARIGYSAAGVMDQQARINGEDNGSLRLGELLEVIENAGEVEYSGKEDEAVKGGRDLWLGPTTWLKNWGENTEEAEIGAYVKPESGREEYEILVWDTGPGMKEEHINGDGRGFQISEDVTEAYGGEFNVMYNEVDGEPNPEWQEAAEYLSGRIDKSTEELGCIFSWQLQSADSY